MSKAISDRIRNSKKFVRVKQSLIDQLAEKGADIPAYTDLIDDYMSFWVAKEMTKIDIATRGVYISYNNGGGQTGTKENPSLAYQIKISSQMLKILQQLKLDVDEAGAGDVDDEL